MDKKQLKEINDWLNSDRDFDSGVALYDRLGKNRNLKRNFQKFNNYSAEKLPYEIAKLAGLPSDGRWAVKDAAAAKDAPDPLLGIGSGQVATDAPTTPEIGENEPLAEETTPQETTPNDSIKPDVDAPREVLDIWSAYLKAYDMMRDAKGRMKELPEDAEHDERRNELASDIVSHRDYITEARRLLEYYKANGSLPATETPADEVAAVVVLPEVAAATNVPKPESLPKTLDLTKEADVAKRIATLGTYISKHADKPVLKAKYELERDYLRGILNKTIAL